MHLSGEVAGAGFITLHLVLPEMLERDAVTLSYGLWPLQSEVSQHPIGSPPAMVKSMGEGGLMG